MEETGKKGNHDQGFIWMPYIMMSAPTIISGVSPKNILRKEKIKNIFFGIPISNHNFSPKKLISSRYTTKIINNNFFGTISNKKTLI